MSIQQVKNCFEEMSAYLARDVAGLAKTRKLKDAVNVLRTRLAAAEAEAMLATEIQSTAIERAISAERDRDEMRCETHRLRQIVANLTNELAATKHLDDAHDDDDANIGDTEREAEVKLVLKQLRKRMPLCPMMVA